MNWEELVEKAYEFGYKEHCGDGDIDERYYFLRKDDYESLSFYDYGYIEDCAGFIIADDRTYEQMYQVMVALGKTESHYSSNKK